MSFPIESITNDTVVVKMGSNLDFRNAPDFKEVYETQVSAGIRNFILDFSDTRILDSCGFGSLFTLYRKLRAHRGQICFASVSEPVQEAVQLTHVYKIFPQFDTVELAFESI